MMLLSPEHPALSRELVQFFRTLGEAAQDFGAPIYLVGGMTRDLLRHEHCEDTDIDLLLEGDGIRFGSVLKERWESYCPELPPPHKLIAFPKFQTAKLVFSEDVFEGVNELDFASARAEEYPAPGQPPVVTSGTLETDLKRRDFSVNAMALGLSVGNFAKLYDFCDGKAHLARKVLAVLHRNSFADDPARLLRAVRFSVRLDFSLETETGELFTSAIKKNFLKTLPKSRLFDEFRKTLVEPKVDRILKELKALGFLWQVHPKLDYSKHVVEKYEALKDGANGTQLVRLVSGDTVELWICLLNLLFFHLSAKEEEDILEEFLVPKKTRLRILKTRALLEANG